MDILETDAISLGVDPDFGARVMRMADRRSGRDWLVGGPPEGSAAEDAGYGGKAARGWDECFPTVVSCTDAFWGRLRDHGVLWGRPWRTVDRGATHATHVFDGTDFTFGRTIALAGAAVEVRYELANLGDAPMPWMWSQHCLLALRPGEVFTLDGLGPLVSRGGRFAPGPVEGPEAGRAVKGYAPVAGAARAGVSGPDGGIVFEWEEACVGHCGIWCDYGGWPAEDPVHQVAIEPTTAPADDLSGAGTARLVLDPGARSTWSIRITLKTSQEALT